MAWTWQLVHHSNSPRRQHGSSSPSRSPRLKPMRIFQALLVQCVALFPDYAIAGGLNTMHGGMGIGLTEYRNVRPLATIKGGSTDVRRQDLGTPSTRPKRSPLALVAGTDFFTIGARFQEVARHEVGVEEELEKEDETSEGRQAMHDREAGRASQTPRQAEKENGRYRNLQYTVVAIVGPQASGKSTLLNALYGTGFPVLEVGNVGVGRRTTQGVWVDMGVSDGARGMDSRNRTGAEEEEEGGVGRARVGRGRIPVVVMDTEGLESVSRGPGSHLFDRQLSTLAVTTADVILLNAWARDMRGGRWGSDLRAGLLETLVRRSLVPGGTEEGMEGKAQKRRLDTKKGGFKSLSGRRPVLVVVLRDSECLEGDVLGAQTIIQRHLDEAYGALGQDPPPSSPGGRAGLQGIAESRVDVRVVAMPSKAFQPLEFQKAVEELRQILQDPTGSPAGNEVTGMAVRAQKGERQGKGGRKTMSSFFSSSLSEHGRQFQPVPLRQFPTFVAELWESIIQESAGGATGDLTSLPSSSLRKEEEVQAFVLRKILDSCMEEAEQGVERLERKVEAAASEMPILEYGRDADAIVRAALQSLEARLPPSTSSHSTPESSPQADLLKRLTRRLAPSYRQHVDALEDFYFGKFQDRFVGLFLPSRALDREAKFLTNDVATAFHKAAVTAVPSTFRMKEEKKNGGKGEGGAWSWEGAMERLRDEMDVEVADRRMEVEVLFPGEEEAQGGKNRLLRASWWRKVLLKAAVVFVNYLQTVQAAQALTRAARRRQEKYPPLPIF